MDNAGLYFLLMGGTDFTISGPGAQEGDWLTDLDGMISASLHLDFRGPAVAPGLRNGNLVQVYFQTSLDDGNTPVDLACCVFTGTDRRVLTISAVNTSSAPTVPTDAAIADDTVGDGVLGNRLRLKIVISGTWSGTYLGARVVVR